MPWKLNLPYIYIDIDMEGTALRKRCHTNDDFKNLFPWVFPWISQFANRKKSPFGPCWVALVVCKPVRKKTESESARGHRLHGSYSVFLHITHPKGCRQHSTNKSKIELPCRKNGLRQTQHSPPRTKNKKAPASRQRISSFRSLCWCQKERSSSSTLGSK